MSESYSVEAILSVIDQGFTQAMERAERQTQALKNSGVMAGAEMGKSMQSMGQSMLNVGTKMTAGITTPIIGAVTAGVSEFAKLEQSIGGIETMFKGSAKIVINNAESAYRRAGVSANDYMENVTSFSASLLQGLEGDTKKAARYADMAMVDMADNANKFGTNIGDIQRAYQGFAKDNFTMLDNLKLGRKPVAEYKPSEFRGTLKAA